MAKKRRYCYDYPRPMVTTDCAVFRVRERKLEVLLVRRAHAPYKGRWVLPGGFIKMREPLEKGAARELAEETGISGIPFLLQLGAYGDPWRDPRGRTVTIAFIGIIAGDGTEPQAGDDAAEAAWYPVEKLPPRLGYDHPTIIGDAILRLAAGGGAGGALFAFLPNAFSEEELADVLFAVYGVELNPKQYLAPFLKMDLVRRTRGRKYRYAGRKGRSLR